MDRDYFRYEPAQNYRRARRKKTNFFAWSVAILLLTGFALAAWRALQHQLFGVQPFNVPVLAAAAAVVALCALAASALPARRATAIAPIDALRTE